MPNGPVFECHLKTGQIDAILFSYVLVRYLNGRSSTHDLALDQPFEYQTIEIRTYLKKFGIQNVGTVGI